MRAISYDEALVALKGALKFGINPSLEGIAQLCEQLGRPQDALSVIQVTGTNGKSSTCRFIEALLRREGFITGLYTSPELERYPERMEIGGAVVSDEAFAAAVGAALDAAERARPGASGSSAGFTEFELLTAGALWLFRESGVQCAVLEVGLGGRWDATSIAQPRIAVITGVGLDHTAILGDTVELIASEKAAIIRPGSVAILGPGTLETDDVFVAQARSVGARIVHVRGVGERRPAEGETESFRVLERPASPAGRTVLGLEGPAGAVKSLSVSAPAYQAANVATAFAAVSSWLGRPPASAQDALADARLPGRFEIVRRDPIAIVDGSHNPQAASVLARAIADAWPEPRERPVIVLGVLEDKDAEGIVAALAQVAEGFIVTSPESPRARSAASLAEIVGRISGVEPRAFDRLDEALGAVSETGRPFVVTGSLTTAGQARGLLRV